MLSSPNSTFTSFFSLFHHKPLCAEVTKGGVVGGSAATAASSHLSVHSHEYRRRQRTATLLAAAALVGMFLVLAVAEWKVMQAVEAAPSSSSKKVGSIGKIKVKNQNHTAKARRSASTGKKLAIEKELGFFAPKKKDPSVYKLPSGLMFKIITKGKGLKSPNHDDPISIVYSGIIGTDPEQKVFDGTGAPNDAVSPQRILIEGWAEALQLMREGDEWEVYLPHNLAFGEEGVDGIIPEFAPIIYRINLVKILSASGGKDAEDNEAVFLRHFGKEYDEL